MNRAGNLDMELYGFLLIKCLVGYVLGKAVHKGKQTHFLFKIVRVFAEFAYSGYCLQKDMSVYTKSQC